MITITEIAISSIFCITIYNVKMNNIEKNILFDKDQNFFSVITLKKLNDFLKYLFHLNFLLIT